MSGALPWEGDLSRVSTNENIFPGLETVGTTARGRDPARGPGPDLRAARSRLHVGRRRSEASSRQLCFPGLGLRSEAGPLRGPSSSQVALPLGQQGAPLLWVGVCVWPTLKVLNQSFKKLSQEQRTWK